MPGQVKCEPDMDSEATSNFYNSKLKTYSHLGIYCNQDTLGHTDGTLVSKAMLISVVVTPSCHLMRQMCHDMEFRAQLPH